MSVQASDGRSDSREEGVSSGVSLYLSNQALKLKISGLEAQLERTNREMREGSQDLILLERERQYLQNVMNNTMARITDLHLHRAEYPYEQFLFNRMEVLDVPECVEILKRGPKGHSLVARKAKPLGWRGAFLLQRHLQLKYEVEVEWIKHAASKRKRVLNNFNGVIRPSESIYVILKSEEMVDKVMSSVLANESLDTVADPWSGSKHALFFYKFDHSKGRALSDGE